MALILLNHQVIILPSHGQILNFQNLLMQCIFIKTNLLLSDLFLQIKLKIEKSLGRTKKPKKLTKNMRY